MKVTVRIVRRDLFRADLGNQVLLVDVAEINILVVHDNLSEHTTLLTNLLGNLSRIDTVPVCVFEIL